MQPLLVGLLFGHPFLIGRQEGRAYPRERLPPLVSVHGGEGAAGLWSKLPGGVRIKRVGNYWIKEVDPEASRLAQWWGRGTLKAQAKGLEKLGDMAPDFLYREGKIITRHAGEFEGGVANYWRTWWEGTKRLGTPMNDIFPRNIGAGGVVFDPALHPLHQAARWALIPTTAAAAKVTADSVATSDD